jgi:hypothetical protein
MLVAKRDAFLSLGAKIRPYWALLGCFTSFLRNFQAGNPALSAADASAKTVFSNRPTTSYRSLKDAMNRFITS